MGTWHDDWVRGDKVRIAELRTGERFVSALGEVWTYFGPDGAGMHRAESADVAGKRRPKGWTSALFADTAEVVRI